MRILIVSSGLKPAQFGGLPSHVEDLLNALVKSGLEIAYLNTGAKSMWPVTRSWKRSDLPCQAWDLSSKLAYSQYWHGTIRPLSQIFASKTYRKAFFSVIDQFKPDLVHVHELTGFPIELFKDLRRRSIKTIFSAHDFYVLCPTVKLFRPDHSLCEKTASQLDCHTCSMGARSERSNQWEFVNDQWLGRTVRIRNLSRRLIRFFERCCCKPASQQLFIERRWHFEQVMGDVDVVLATSRAQMQIFEQRTTGWNVRFLQLSRSTIRPDLPTLRLTRRSADKLIFVALNIVNPAKGLSILETAFGALQKEHPEIELHLYGLADGNAPGIRFFGPYEDHQLDEIIGAADFGILPSIWPEAFGYVGPEMLSRGLPVLASNCGAMPDYVIDGVNGLLFESANPKALENSIRKLLHDAALCKKLWQGAANGERRYLSMDEHTKSLLEIYRQVIDKNK